MIDPVRRVYINIYIYLYRYIYIYKVRCTLLRSVVNCFIRVCCRSNAQPKRGRASKRMAPYRAPTRHHRDGPSTSWASESQTYPPFPPWPPMHWAPPKTSTQPLPPGEDKQPQRFGPTPDAGKIRCFSCFKYGHKSPNCPDKQSQSQ